MTRIRKDNDLEAAARHVSYEIRMIVISSKGLGGYHSSPQSIGDDEKNLRLEAFLLHFRNLHAFLYPSRHPIKEDDVFGSDFLEKEKPEDIGGDTSWFNKDEQRRLNKMLAHISYERSKYISSGRPGWNVAILLRSIVADLETFLAKLPAEKRSWFRSADESITFAKSLAFDIGLEQDFEEPGLDSFPEPLTSN